MRVGRGGRREKQGALWNRRHGLQSLRKKRHLMYRASFQGQAAARFGFGDSNGVAISRAHGKMVFRRRRRGGDIGKRAPESHFGCQDSLSEPSLRWPEPKDLRGTRLERLSVFLPKEESRESVQL